MARVPLAAAVRAGAGTVVARTVAAAMEAAGVEVEARVWVPEAVGHRAAATGVGRLEVMVVMVAA